MNLTIALILAANAIRPGGDMRDVSMVPPSGATAASLTIDAMPYTRTVTCGSYTLTGSASGGGAVSWSASPSGASGSCTGTTSWSCVVDVDPDAVGEGVEVITVTDGVSSDTETIGFYVDGEHSCFLAQNLDGSYNSTVSNLDAVATWTNLGSSAKNVTQGTGTLQPTFRASIVGGQPIVRCDGGDRLAAATASDWTYLHDGTGSTIESVTLISASPAIQFVSSTTPVATTAQVGYATGIATLFRAQYYMVDGTATRINATGLSNTVSTAKFDLHQATLASANTPDMTTYINGTSAITANAAAFTSSAPFSALNICGSSNGNFPLAGDIFRVVAYPSSLDATQRGINKAVDEWALGGTLPVTASSTERWLFVGDSLTAGNGGVTPWPKKLEGYVTGADVIFSNVAVGSTTSAQILTQWNNNKVATPTKVFVLGGINDIAVGTSAATAYSSLSTIYSQAAALGTQVIAMPTLPFGNAGSWSSADQTQLELLEDSIIADANVDILVNFYDLMGEPGTPIDLAAIYDNGDGVHPNEAGTTFMAAEVAAALGL